MSHLPEHAYLESRVYTANPSELIQMLYEAALAAIQDAIEAVHQGEIERRARSVTKATSCIMELAGSLNVEAGGELGVRLAVLYEYLLHQLLEANVKQEAAPLQDCERVVASLLEGWSAAVAQLDGAHAAETANGQQIPAGAVNGELTVTSNDVLPLPVEDTPPYRPAWTRSVTADVYLDEFHGERELQSTANSWCG